MAEPSPSAVAGGRSPLLRLLVQLSRQSALAEMSTGPGGLAARILISGAAPDATPRQIAGIAVQDWEVACGLGHLAVVPAGDGSQLWRITGKGRTHVKRLLSRAVETAPGDSRGDPGGDPGSDAGGEPHGDACAPAVSRAPRVNLDESPLSWLARRRDRDGALLISPEQFTAGERLRADFTFAQMSPRVTLNWSAEATGQSGSAHGGAGVEMRDSVIVAGERVRRALKAVGPELAGILIDVCCHLKGLEAAEKGAGWPQRSGKVVLQLALTRLARHYGLIGDPKARAARGGVRHWGAGDYRPVISPGNDSDVPGPDIKPHQC